MLCVHYTGTNFQKRFSTIYLGLKKLNFYFPNIKKITFVPVEEKKSSKKYFFCGICTGPKTFRPKKICWTAFGTWYYHQIKLR
jgi:hypothetical protein